MKNFVVVCLMIVFGVPVAASAAVAEEPSPFTLAERVGDPDARYFFMFSTSAGNYTIRQDGMGEITFRTGMRKVIYLKASLKDRIARLYFLEHQGDLILLYESSGSGYLVRIDQKTRKTRWTKTVSGSFAPPAVKGESVVFDDGTIVPLNSHTD